MKWQGKKIQTAGPLTPEGGIEQPSIGHWSLGAAGPLTPEGGTNPDAMRSKLYWPKKALEIREEGLLLEALFEFLNEKIFTHTFHFLLSFFQSAKSVGEDVG